MPIPEDTIESISEYTAKIEALLSNNDAKLWFRGHSSHTHKLEPSLYRHPEIKSSQKSIKEIEERTMVLFKESCAPYVQNIPENDWDILFLAQHYGIPTRLLDWTDNPYIALYFALSSGNANDDSVVWILDPVKLNIFSKNNSAIKEVFSPYGRVGENFMQNRYDDQIADRHPLAITASRSNPRIAVQRGVFTVFGTTAEPMEDKPDAEKFLNKIIIKSKDKAPLFQVLLRIGYSQTTVYPDLSGLSTEIKTLVRF